MCFFPGFTCSAGNLHPCSDLRSVLCSVPSHSQVSSVQLQWCKSCWTSQSHSIFTHNELFNITLLILCMYITDTWQCSPSFTPLVWASSRRIRKYASCCQYCRFCTCWLATQCSSGWVMERCHCVQSNAQNWSHIIQLILRYAFKVLILVQLTTAVITVASTNSITVMVRSSMFYLSSHSSILLLLCICVDTTRVALRQLCSLWQATSARMLFFVIVHSTQLSQQLQFYTLSQAALPAMALTTRTGVALWLTCTWPRRAIPSLVIRSYTQRGFQCSCICLIVRLGELWM